MGRFQQILPRLAIPFITLVVIWTSSNINWGPERFQRIIKVDGNGYYAYLPAIFIYHDLSFGFFEEIASREGYQNETYEYRYTFKGSVVNKYFAGTALAQLPFFLTAHALSIIIGLPADGYSRIYLIFISLAAAFYLLLGCFFTAKLLKSYGISPVNRALALLLITFGTNLFYYTVYEPSMSHVYSFGLVSAFALAVRLFFQKGKRIYLLAGAFLFGMVVLIRPVNGMIILAVPFLAGSPAVLVRGMKTLARPFFFALLPLALAFIPIAIQLAIYKVQTGQWWIYSYGEEHFDLLKPHFLDILFSYRKGLFLYTPLLLLSCTLGGYYLYRENRFMLFTWLGFFILVTYVLSCWEQWYYGGSFSGRVFVEYYSFFAVLLGISLENVRKGSPRKILLAILILLVVLCLVQTYQYYTGQLHWSDMDREKYWDIFMRVDRFFNQ